MKNNKRTQKLEEFHHYSRNHAKEILSGHKAGCFYCCKEVDVSKHDQLEWIDGFKTLLCPKCGIDSVIPACKFKHQTVKLEFLQKMHDYWFTNFDR